MLDILLISDQPRLHAILTSASTFPEGSFRIATSLAQGLQHISERSPDLLFLQNRLSGLAGTILVRHVRSSTSSDATRIVLLADGYAEAEESAADIVLHTNVSDAELSDAVAEIIGETVTEEAHHPGTTANQAPVVIPTTPLPEAVDTVSLTTPSSAAGSRLQISHEPSANPLSKEIPAETTILSTSPPPIQWEKRRLVIALSALAAIVVAGTALYIVISRPFITPAPKKPAPLPQVPKTAAPPVVEPPKTAAVPKPAPLPGFIKAETIDPSYTMANPGWERYRAENREFKIFRENGTIKAIQVIALNASGIQPKFFTATIREMARVTDYKLESRERRDGFVIKKGRLSPSSRVIIYKDKNDRVLNAFVIHFQDQAATVPAAKGKP